MLTHVMTDMTQETQTQTIDRNVLRQSELRVSSSRWHIDHQVIQRTPTHLHNRNDKEFDTDAIPGVISRRNAWERHSYC